MKTWLRLALCALVITVGSWERLSYAEEVQTSVLADKQLGQNVTLLESFKIMRGDTLWGYWISNARTREMYRGDWGRFLVAVSEFNTISEWRSVHSGTIVHIPLPLSNMVGFSVAGATAPTLTVVLEQSKVRPGFYRLSQQKVMMTAPAMVQPLNEAELIASQRKEIDDLRQEMKQIVAQGTKTLGNELAIRHAATDVRLDRHFGWIRGVFFFAILLVVMLGVVSVLLLVRPHRSLESSRGVEILAQRLIEQERLRVAALRDVESAQAALGVAQKELKESRAELSHARQLYDSILTETKVQMEHMAPYIYRFVVSGKWFAHPDVGKTLLVMMKEVDKKIFLKPYGAEDWMLVENVEPYLKGSEQARRFYGLGDPVDRPRTDHA